MLGLNDKLLKFIETESLPKEAMRWGGFADFLAQPLQEKTHEAFLLSMRA